ncbi:MAG: enoyl-CoA hydratase/isomerase family protein [Candidatus Marinimicrobia bacterium]|nr:enoyl-CoA hydratase/isomerase family protein [Candidatus Neomarinimicrobiota bacterium]
MISYKVDDRNIGVLTLDRPDKPLNILSAASFEELERLLTGLAEQDTPPAGLVIISGKADNFIVGADIKVFAGFRTAADGAQASRQGQRIFGLFAALPFPTVAAINGTCLGGGLELALNCTSRIITHHPKTALGLPEVKLGLLPGASGSQYLSRLVGVQKALDMMLTGKNIYPYPARKMGLADEIVSPGVLLEAAKAQVLRLAKGQFPKRPKRALIARLLDGPLKGLVFRGAKKQVLATTMGNYPAPLEIIKVVRQGLGRSLAAGLKVEAQGFGRLTQTPEHKAMTHLFFAGRGSKTVHQARPRPSRITLTWPLPAGIFLEQYRLRAGILPDEAICAAAVRSRVQVGRRFDRDPIPLDPDVDRAHGARIGYPRGHGRMLMKSTKRSINGAAAAAAAVVLLLGLAFPAWADSKAADDAVQRGDYETALRELIEQWIKTYTQ